MSTLQVIFAAWFTLSLLAIRPVGTWYMGKPVHKRARCHNDGVGSASPAFCRIYHGPKCWRMPVARYPERTLGTGFAIVGFSLAWPLLLLPALALRLTPKSDPELRADNERLIAEIARLESDTEMKP